MPATRSKNPINLAGIEAAEIKVTIRPDQELLAERALGLSDEAAQVRSLFFYDTSQLALFDANVALRARLITDDDDDSTVKIREVAVAEITEKWKQERGFKVEADYVGDREIVSASLTVKQKRGEIEAVADGKREIHKLFSQEQEDFLAQFYRHKIDFGALRMLGPIDVLRWKLKPKGFAHEMTVEEWRLPNGDDLVEVSFKTPAQDAAEAREGFEAYLRSLRLDPEGAQQAKTRAALEYFAQISNESSK